MFHSCNILSHTVSLPVVLKHPDPASIDLFQSAVFECSFQSFGALKITWKKDGHLLPSKASKSVTSSKNTVTGRLQINRAVGYYSGKYYCEAENIAGKVVSRTAVLHVQGKCYKEFAQPWLI